MDIVSKASKILAIGKIISMPTDTVIALCVDSFIKEGVDSLFSLKKRNPQKSFAVFVKNLDWIQNNCIINQKLLLQLFKFIPGELTVVLELKNTKEATYISHNLNITDNTLAIRIPNSKFCLELLNKYPNPIVATSANISGQNILGNMEAVQQIFAEQIGLYIESSKENFHNHNIHNIASTIIDLTKKPYKILRKGRLKLDLL